MANLSTTYMGLKLKSPIVVSSSGLTNNAEKIAQLEEYGAGAVVLKSLFEEQIKFEASMNMSGADYPEAADYINSYVRSHSVDDYINLIESSKKRVSIPVMASINCVSDQEWTSFAKEIEAAGADALELNVFFLPNKITDSHDIESLYFSLLDRILSAVKIPVAVKIGQQFTNLPAIVNGLYLRGAKGIVAFNRFYAPDIDIDNLKITASEIFSNPADLRQTLRWIGILSNLVDKVDIAASTGVHDGKSALKLILAGAAAVQVCSVLYKNGPEYLQQINSEIESWMQNHDIDTLKEIKGRLNYNNITDAGLYERTQFMKYFSSRE